MRGHGSSATIHSHEKHQNKVGCKKSQWGQLQKLLLKYKNYSFFKFSLGLHEGFANKNKYLKSCWMKLGVSQGPGLHHTYRLNHMQRKAACGGTKLWCHCFSPITDYFKQIARFWTQELTTTTKKRWQVMDACHHTYTLWIEWDVFCEFTSVVYRDRGEKHTKRPHIQLFRINTNTSSEERSVLKSSPLLWIIHLSDFCLFNIVS